MKVAVLLSGQPRSFQKYSNCIQKNIIEPNKADVFFHTWSEDPSLISQLLTAYRPVSYEAESQKTFVNNDIDFTHTLQQGYAGGAENPKVAQYYAFATRSMWWSLRQGFKLIGDHRSYDYVVKCRFDSCLSRPIICKSYDPHYLWAEDLGKTELVNNWINFGSYEVMKKYCNIYDHIPRLYQDTGIWCNEYWIKKIMDENGIQVAHDQWGLTIENTDIRTFQ
jgi:hypothetical protein